MIAAKYRRPSRKRPAPPIECSLSVQASYGVSAGGIVKTSFALIDSEGEVVSGAFELGLAEARKLVRDLQDRIEWADSAKKEAGA